LWGLPPSAIRLKSDSWLRCQESRSSLIDPSFISALSLWCKGKNARVRGRTAEGGCLHKIL
jgi:hypothetical protein